ncbi:MAG: stage II sporulation protein M [Candidatus Ancillula trichonymphae]|jgi:uncharacterized membrane protein SpoIIM required for sporulation|nr:stage II sporulation protein M [Candidatus Ancillula trichonymphae]
MLKSGCNIHCLIISLCIYIISFGIAAFLSRNQTYTIDYKGLGFTDLFFHNQIQGLTIILYGLLTFGIGNSVLLVINAFNAAGVVVILVYNSYGIRPLLLHFFPHALFEISALIIFTTIVYILSNILFSLDVDNLLGKIKRLLLVIASLLLVIAAIIESAVPNI